MVDNYPVMAFVDPTLFCNLRCPACPTGLNTGQRPRATLNEALFTSFIDQVGEYLFKLYLYNLGEPLLHKQTPEFIKYAKDKEIFVMVSSNLSMELSDEYLQRLVQSGLDVLVVPLDGLTSETYQTYRRGGDFQRVRLNMLRIKELKKRLGSDTPSVCWQFLVFEHNEHEVDFVRQKYKEWGADEYVVGGAYMPGGSITEGLKPSSRGEFDIYDAGHYHRKKTVKAFMERKPCSWLYGVTVLNSNGRVSPCAYTVAEKDDFGHFIPGMNYSQVYNGERFIKARSLCAQPTAAWQNNETWEQIGHRMDGRGETVARSLADGQLLCQKCPVPFLQDVVDHELSFDEGELVRFIEKSFELTESEQARFESLKQQLQAAK
jgi:MoaA/NifB/PqqE/SkfB family radical SAM enzyme